MLTQVAGGVLVHRSELLQDDAVVVPGPTGALLVDPGTTGREMARLADLRGLLRLEDVADGVDVLVPGHGSVGGPAEVR